MGNLIFDTHAHYDDKSFDEDRSEVLKMLPKNNVFAVVNAGADIESSVKSIEISKEYDYVYASVGIHPENIPDDKSDYMKILEDLLKNEKVVAIGEIGLDYHYTKDNKADQIELFENQINLAVNHDLPIMVHDREAHGDTMDLLKKHNPKGIVHCFSGSVEMAKEVIKLGMYIGIGGLITFKNAKTAVNVVENIPLSSIVLETDAPYMTPVPFRGTRCNSSHIKYTAEKIAEIKKIDVNEVLKITKENALKLFNL